MSLENPQKSRAKRTSQENDPNDTDVFNRFMPSSTANDLIQASAQGGSESGEGTNLADLILERIAAHEALQGGKPVVQGEGDPDDAIELPAKVVEVYQK